MGGYAGIMYKVRPLKELEVPLIIEPEVGKHFATMGWGEINYKYLAATVLSYVEREDATAIALWHNDKLVGLLTACVFPFFATGKLLAHQIFIYIIPGHRGAYIRLMRAFEKWAKNKGATRISASALLRENGLKQMKLLERMGYKPDDVYYSREVR
jgi:GNAT superfamily N-acetyltransferase